VKGIQVMHYDEANRLSATLYKMLGMLQLHELSQVQYRLDFHFRRYKCITSAVIGCYPQSNDLTACTVYVRIILLYSASAVHTDTINRG
jgi:hypothetical protein